jgi:hypothetical protein
MGAGPVESPDKDNQPEAESDMELAPWPSLINWLKPGGVGKLFDKDWMVYSIQTVFAVVALSVSSTGFSHGGAIGNVAGVSALIAMPVAFPPVRDRIFYYSNIIMPKGKRVAVSLVIYTISMAISVGLLSMVGALSEF